LCRRGKLVPINSNEVKERCDVIIDSATLDPVHAYKLLIGSILPARHRLDQHLIERRYRQSGANLVLHGSRPPSEADEFVEVGLEKAPSLVVRPPRVSGAPISMECRVYKIIPVGEIGDHMIIGEVLRFHIRDDLYLERGRIDTAAIQSVGRLAAEYTLVENVFATPLDGEILRGRADQRRHRLDAHPDRWSPIDTKAGSRRGYKPAYRGDALMPEQPPTAILVHGFLDSGEVWRPVINILGACPS
jgi:hypothetical protein